MTSVAFFEKLKEHDIEMNKLNELESGEKKVKNITMKSSSKKNDVSDENVAELGQNKNPNLLVKKFGNYLKRRSNKGVKGGTILNEMN